MMQSKDSLEYSHYDTDKEALRASKDSFASSPIQNILSSQKAYSSYSSNKKPYASPPIKISDEERDFSSSNRYKEYEKALQSSKEKDYIGSSNEDFFKRSRSNPYKPYEDANNEKSQRYENEESFQRKYRDQLYSSAKKIRDTLEESVDEIERRINQIEKEINSSVELPKEPKRIEIKHPVTTSHQAKESVRKAKELKEMSPPMTFKERKDEKKIRFSDDKPPEQGWSIREEKLLKEMDALRKENTEIKQDLRSLMQRLEKEEKAKEKEKSKEKVQAQPEEPKLSKPASKQSKPSLKDSKVPAKSDLDIDKEIEIL